MDKKGIKRLVKDTRSTGRTALVEPEAKEILRLGSVEVPEFKVVKDVSEAIEAAGELGYPVALKIVSSEIAHKSDVGGVALDISGPEELEEKWSTMILMVADENPVAMIEGFMVEKMVPKGVEVIVGAVKDGQFGTYVMYGTGGVAVELMKDVSFRLAPLDMDEARGMIEEVKGYPLLTGFRGDKPRDVEAVAEVIIKLAEIVEETDLKEFEVNPLVVHTSGAVAVDARGAILGL